MAIQPSSLNAVAFYHQNGFVPAFEQASKFAGSYGRVATLPDIISARLNTPPAKELGTFNSRNPSPWDQYFTTMSAEYVGLTKTGAKVIIVAHGVGPMATSKGVVEAYRYHFSDKTRSRRGGRISRSEFLKLESGAYGDVSVIDFESYTRRRQYPFISALRSNEAMDDPLVLARLGPQAKKYLRRHTALARRWHKQEHPQAIIEHPFIMTMRDESNCPYQHVKIDEDLALAHLLSIGQIANVHGWEGDHPVTHWSCDVTGHGWHDGTRLVGVRTGEVANIFRGPDAHQLLRKKWSILMELSGIESTESGSYVLTKMSDDTWFTQVDKVGGAMDTGEPEFKVISIEPIGKPVKFSTPVCHYHGFFKYHKCEALAALPEGANAYVLVGNPANIYEDGNPVRQVCMIQPYRVVVDMTQRLARESNLINDYDRLMRLYETP
jgi:hypothetical protein